MAEDKKHKLDQEAVSANQEINDKLDGQQEAANDVDTDSLSDTEQANLELNEQLDSNDQDSSYSPPSYVNLNTAAVDVTKKD